MSELISIAGLDKAEVLAALWNVARCPDLGCLNPEVLPASYLRECYVPGPDEPPGRRTLQYGVLVGRKLMVDLSGDSFDPTEYDRHNLEDGLAERAIAALRNKLASAPESQAGDEDLTLSPELQAILYANNLLVKEQEEQEYARRRRERDQW